MILPDRPPSFSRILTTRVGAVVIVLGMILLATMVWQGISSTREAERHEIREALEQTTERLQLLVRSAEMTAESVEHAARYSEVTGATLRTTLESSLSAFEQRPELSYIGIVIPETGEYGTLERTATGEILLWLFPGTRMEDAVTRIFLLTDKGFVLREERPTDGYDPRKRPFYQAALDSPTGGGWMPTYQWIVHGSNSTPLWGFSYVKAVRDETGKLICVLDTDYDMPALNRFLGPLAREHHCDLHVVELGKTNRLIGGSEVAQAPLTPSEQFSPLLGFSGDVFVERMKLEGEARWVAARHLPLHGGVSWLVVASRKDAFIAAPLRRQLYQVVGMGILSVTGLMLILIRMARGLGEPLTELERCVSSIENQKDPSKPLAIATSGAIASKFRETQLLSEAMSHMTGVVQHREHELAVQSKQLIEAQNRLLAFNAELEQRVADRTRELQIINQELESFCYSVSHDLRAPLRGIAGFSEILAKNYSSALDGKAQDYLNRVLAATQRMGELIDDLLNLSRVSREEMRRERVNLSTIAREVLDQLQQTSPERQLEIVIEDNLYTEGDARLLRVMLENLLGNAWKFTSKTANARIVFSSVDGGNGETAFAVSDNGAGFDMSYAGKLFGAFQRLHRATEFPGTGIGLATVQRIINRHGGRISAHAEPGKGASFQFSFASSVS